MRHFFLIVFGCIIAIFAGCSGISLPGGVTSARPDCAGRMEARISSLQDTLLVKGIPLREVWACDAGAGFGPGTPVLRDGKLFVGTLQGELHVIDALSGDRIGYHKFKVPIAVQPVIDSTVAIVSCDDEQQSLIALDLVSGKIRWSAALGGCVAAPVLCSGLVYVGTLEGIFVAVEAQTGTIRWKYELRKPLRSTCAVVDSLVVFGSDDGVLYALNSGTGNLQWQFKSGAAIVGGITAVKKKILFGSRDSYLYCVERETGTLRWKYNAGGMIVAAPAAADSMVYVTTLGGGISGVSLESGICCWQYESRSVINITPALSSDVLVAASLNKCMYLLSKDSGVLLETDTLEARVKTSPVIWRNRLFIAAEDTKIHCFQSVP